MATERFNYKLVTGKESVEPTTYLEQKERDYADRFFEKYVNPFITSGLDTKNKDAVAYARNFLNLTEEGDTINKQTLESFIDAHVETYENIIENSIRRELYFKEQEQNNSHVAKIGSQASQSRFR